LGQSSLPRRGQGLEDAAGGEQLGEDDGLGLARLKGTAERFHFASSAVMAGSLLVQSAFSRSTLRFSNSASTSPEVKTAALLVWQVAHQRAVKST
jgi:hypothetical protein